MANLTKPAATATPAIKPVKPLVFLKTDADIAKSITGIKSRGTKLMADIHLTACSVLCIMESQRAQGTSTDHANNLVSALPNGVRKNALIDWFMDYSFMSYDEDKKRFFIDKASDKKTNLTKAESMPFWLHKPEPEYHAFNWNTELANLIAKAQRHLDKKNALDVIDMESLSAVKALLPVAPLES